MDSTFHALSHAIRRDILDILRAMPIQQIYERWIDGYSAHWLDRMSLIKQTTDAVTRKTSGLEEK